jgi:hypothetical protein
MGKPIPRKPTLQQLFDSLNGQERKLIEGILPPHHTTDELLILDENQIIVLFHQELINKIVRYSSRHWGVIPVVYINNDDNNSSHTVAKWKTLLYFINNDKTIPKMLDAIVIRNGNNNNNNKNQSSISELEHIIKQFTSLLSSYSPTENMAIFDPLMGSGDIATVALNIGMRFIGIEDDPKKFEIAKSKIEDKTHNKLQKKGGNIIKIDPKTQLTDENGRMLYPTIMRGDIRDCFKLNEQLSKKGLIDNRRGQWTKMGVRTKKCSTSCSTSLQ